MTESSLTAKGFKRQDTGGDYTYDANGNLKTDPNKGISLIEYNHLNLPTQVTFTNGNVIQWLYDASGTKLRKTTIAPAATITLSGQPLAPGAYISTGLLTSTGTVSANTTITMRGRLGVELLPNFEAQSNSNFEAVQDVTITGDVQDYVGGVEYKNGAFEAIYHSEGRVIMMNGLLKYEYALKDHLGNTRLLFSDNDNNGVISQNANQELSEVSQEQHYYSFGMAMEGTWSNTPSVSDSKYLYNGKEMNSDFGLDWMDYGARMYDGTVGRFFVVDRFSEKYYSFNPYQYAANNPIRFIDINGDSIGINANLNDVKNNAQAKSFNAFASTKEGISYLSKFAKKGQTIAGHKYTQDGVYHKKGLNINYEGKDLSGNTRGVTTTDGKNTITVSLDTDTKFDSHDDKKVDASSSSPTHKEAIFDKAMTLFHETMLHAELHAKDFTDDKKFNFSNIPSSITTNRSYGKGDYQHAHVYYNTNDNLFPGATIRGMIEVNSQLGLKYSTKAIETMTWNYGGGKSK